MHSGAHIASCTSTLDEVNADPSATCKASTGLGLYSMIPQGLQQTSRAKREIVRRKLSASEYLQPPDEKSEGTRDQMNRALAAPQR